MASAFVVINRLTDATVFSVGIAGALMRGMYGFVCGTGRRGIRSRWSTVLAVTIFITQCPFTFSAIVAGPSTAVSFVGGRVRMGCSRDLSSDGVDWEFAPADTNKTSFIYTNRQIPANLTSRYRINTDNQSRYDLVMDSVVWSDAGTYICTPINQGANPQSGSAQLMVLESDPVCTTNASASNGSVVEGGYIQLWCTVNYTGNWIPDMVWNSTTPGQHFAYTIYTTSSISSLTMPLNSSDDGVTVACKTSFNPGNYKVVRIPRDGEVPAKNIPDYHYMWTFSLSVLYGPKKISERIVCWANGNPAPAYEWMEIGTNKTTSGYVLTIDDSLRSEKVHYFRCTAYNTVAGVRKQINDTISFTAVGASSKASSTSLITVMALGFAVVLSVKA